MEQRNGRSNDMATEDRTSDIEEEVLRGFDMKGLPTYMRDGTLSHIMMGLKVGGFLTALFDGNGTLAAGKADTNNRRCFLEWHLFLLHHAPRACYGSEAKVKTWRAGGGLHGSLKRLDEAEEARRVPPEEEDDTRSAGPYDERSS